MKTIDYGDLCLECRQDTSFGSGRFVNRIPAERQDGIDSDKEIGYLCEACLEEVSE